MTHEALVEDLRQKSRERIRQVRHEAEIKSEELRAQKDKEFERRQAEVLGQLQIEAEKVAAPILHEAERAALSIEDEAMSRLAKRMYVLVNEMLYKVREYDYEQVFAKLVKEIPQADWKRVRVNPLDEDLARRYFPGCDVVADPSIIGGFVVSIGDGKYQVINTLKRRLEKGWPTILPLLLREILEEQDAAPSV